MEERKKMTDEQLILKIKNGDILSFEQLVIRYEKRLLRYSKRWLREDKDAEEVVQDSFLKIYKNVRRVDVRKSFSGYLYKITRNTVMDRLRKNKEFLPLFENTVGVKEDDMYEKIAQKQEIGKLNKAIGSLKEKYKKVIRMYYFEELSYKKMQNRLGVPLNTVRTLLKRAKEKLVAKMKTEK